MSRLPKKKEVPKKGKDQITQDSMIPDRIVKNSKDPEQQTLIVENNLEKGLMRKKGNPKRKGK